MVGLRLEGNLVNKQILMKLFNKSNMLYKNYELILRGVLF